MNADLKIARELAEKAADDRAHRIASILAEDFIRNEGVPTSGIDEYSIPQCQADEHVCDCIAHLCWSGEAVSYETDDGYIVIQFLDSTTS